MIRNKKVKGAVSVFLIIILVPCIVVSTIFLDLGRVEMSKASAYASADNALNALMTNYDADLNEWYGMVASCQSIKEFYETSALFFLRNIESRDLSQEEIYLLADYYAAATQDDTIYDFLQVECNSSIDDIVGPADGKPNLTNATLVKDQIVEFMKYRAPIEIVTDLIDRFKNDESLKQQLGGAEEGNENKPLTEKKQAHYEAEGELVKALYKTYLQLKEYQSVGLTLEKLQSYTQKLDEYKRVYNEIHNLRIKYAYNTSGLRIRNMLNFDIKTYQNMTNNFYKNNTIKVTDESGTEHYYISKKTVQNLVNTLNTKINEFNTAKQSYVDAMSECMANLPGEGANQKNTIQWWIKAESIAATSHETVRKAADAMLKAYNDVYLIGECEPKPEDKFTFDDADLDLLGKTLKVEELYTKYLIKANKNKNSTDSFIKTEAWLEDISTQNIYKIGDETVANMTVTVDGMQKKVSEAFSYMSSELDKIYSDVSKAARCLKLAIYGNESDKDVAEEDKVPSLDSIMSMLEKYESTLQEWSKEADNRAGGAFSGTDTEENENDSMPVADQKEILKKADEANITKESITELKNRLVNIHSQLVEIRKFVDINPEMKYCNISLRVITTFGAFSTAQKNAVKPNQFDGFLTNSELKSKSDSTFAQYFKPENTPIYILNTNNSHNPEINPETGKVDTPELYKYIHEKFEKNDEGKSPDSEVEKAEGDEQKANEEAEKKKNNAADGRYTGGGAELSTMTNDWKPSDASAGLSDSIDALVDFIKDLINGDVSNIRDDLYVTTYIMNMFSYATYDNEGMYDLVDDKKALTLSDTDINNANSAYSKVLKEWQNEEITFSDNKTLTNKLINKDYNRAYSAEIEYILYGKATNSENVKEVYNKIFVMRLALNTVSGFQHFWGLKTDTGRAINTIAGTINSLTCGIVPAPLVKVIIIPLLAVFETSKDLDRLQAGFPVEIYKMSADDWWISLDGGTSIADALSAIVKGGSRPNPDKGLFYSDYLMIFVYLGLHGDASTAMYERIANVIQFNMQGDKLTKDTNYDMRNAIVYFKLNATLRVKPLMITLPFSKDETSDMADSTDWCTYNINIVRGYS